MQRTALTALTLLAFSLSSGCKEQVAEKPQVAAQQAAPVPPPKPAMELPADVMAVTGIPSLEAFLSAVNGVANTVAPGSLPPNLASMALESMKADMGLTDISWFKSDAPVLVAVVDPKAFDGKNQLMLLPTSDVAKSLASLKEGAKRDFEGHAAFFEHRFEKIYVDTLEGYVVFTDHPRIFPTLKSFLDEQLRLWKPQEALSIRVRVDHILERYGAEIAQGKEMLRQMAREAAGDDAALDAGKIQDLQIALLFSMLESATHMTLDVSATASDLSFKYTVDAKKGSNLATFLDLVANKESVMLQSLPAGSWASYVAHLDARKFAPLRKIQEASLGAYVTLLELDAETSKSLETLIGELTDQSTGEALASLYTDGEFPLAFVSAQGVEDVVAHRAVLDKLLPILLDNGYRVLSKALEQDGTKLPAAKITSISALVGLVSPFAAAMGITPTLVEKSQGEARADALNLVLDWTVLSRELGVAAEEVETVKLLERVLGGSLQVAFATGPNRSVTALGPHALDHALALAQGKKVEQDPALTSLAKGQNVAMSLRLGAVLRSLLFIPDLAAKKAMVDVISPDRALTVQVDSADQSAVAVIKLPVDVLRDVIALATAP